MLLNEIVHHVLQQYVSSSRLAGSTNSAQLLNECGPHCRFITGVYVNIIYVGATKLPNLAICCTCTNMYYPNTIQYTLDCVPMAYNNPVI